jgi:hypothetical protein
MQKFAFFKEPAMVADRVTCTDPLAQAQKACAR